MTEAFKLVARLFAISDPPKLRPAPTPAAPRATAAAAKLTPALEEFPAWFRARFFREASFPMLVEPATVAELIKVTSLAISRLARILRKIFSYSEVKVMFLD